MAPCCRRCTIGAIRIIILELQGGAYTTCGREFYNHISDNFFFIFSFKV